MAAGWRKIIHSENTISDLATPTGAFSMGNQKITDLGTPVATTDAATKQFVTDNSGGSARDVSALTDDGVITFKNADSTFTNEGTNLSYATGTGLSIASGGLTVGTDGSGLDVTFYSATAGDSMVWDSSDEKLTITGTATQTALDIADGNVVIADDLDVAGTTNVDILDVDSSIQFDGTTMVCNATSQMSFSNSGGAILINTTNDNGVTLGNASSTTSVGGDLTVTGDLTVNGDTTTISTTELEVEDKEIILGKGSSNNAGANLTGITVDNGAATTKKSGIFWMNDTAVSPFEWVMYSRNDVTPIGIAGIQVQAAGGAITGLDTVAGGFAYNSNDGDMYFYSGV
jgi:hypothetical protein